ncbi:GAF domain-containing protein, partial [Streptomyces alkaliterrae]
MRQPGDPADVATGRGAELPEAVLADAVRDTGASVGLVYVLPPGERVLHLVLASGVPRHIAAPWARIPVDAGIPVADAMRQRRLVWLGSQEEIARRYPRLGIVLPYDFMLAAAPITDAATAWGGIVLLWPVWHPPQLSPAEREAISASCHRAAAFLRQAADSGLPPRLPDEPRLLAAPPHHADAEPAQATAALSFTERLPVGCCALDMDGRLTFINSAGAEMVGADAASLLGHRPWEVLRWLHDPAFEDRYRAAVVTRQPTSFTARRPPDTGLVFQLYPSDTGISVQILPAAEEPAATQPRATVPSMAGPVGAAGLYHLTHVATALAEAAGVKDVVELAADQIVPAFGPKALALMTVEEGRLQIAGYRGYSAELVARFDGAPLTSDTPAVRAVATAESSFFPSFADLERAYPPAVHQDKMAAWAFLPLIVSGRPVGSLVLGYEQSRPFPPAER